MSRPWYVGYLRQYFVADQMLAIYMTCFVQGHGCLPNAGANPEGPMQLAWCCFYRVCFPRAAQLACCDVDSESHRMYQWNNVSVREYISNLRGFMNNAVLWGNVLPKSSIAWYVECRRHLCMRLFPSLQVTRSRVRCNFLPVQGFLGTHIDSWGTSAPLNRLWKGSFIVRRLRKICVCPFSLHTQSKITSSQTSKKWLLLHLECPHQLSRAGWIFILSMYSSWSIIHA